MPRIPSAKTGNFYLFINLGDEQAALDILNEEGIIPSKYMGFTALYEAAYFGRIRILEALIAKGYNVNERNESNIVGGIPAARNATPLFGAALNGCTEAAEILLRHGANPHMRCEDEQTPLMAACIEDTPSMVRVLLAHGAKLEERDKNEYTPLLLAAQYAQGEVARELLAHGADRNAICKREVNAFVLASQYDNVECMRALLDGAVPSYLSDMGGTPMVAALVTRSWNAVRFLLEQDFDPNAPDAEGNRAIHYVARVGNRELAQKLIALGADVNALDVNGLSPAHIAAARQSGVLNVLLKVGANPYAVSESEEKVSVLHFAAMEGNEASIRILLQAGVCVDVRDFQGGTPLHYAAEQGKVGAMRALLRAGADINAAGNIGATALHCAARKGHMECVKCLLKAKAVINLTNIDGKTALDLAAEKGYTDICKLLRSSSSR